MTDKQINRFAVIIGVPIAVFILWMWWRTDTPQIDTSSKTVQWDAQIKPYQDSLAWYRAKEKQTSISLAKQDTGIKNKIIYAHQKDFSIINLDIDSSIRLAAAFNKQMADSSYQARYFYTGSR